MSDFSDKYRQAVEEMQISSDFKERTALKMKAVRDEKASHDVNRRLIMMRTFSTAAAAILIVAVGISVKNSEPMTVSESKAIETSIPTEETAPESKEAAIPETDFSDDEMLTEENDSNENISLSVEADEEIPAEEAIMTEEVTEAKAETITEQTDMLPDSGAAAPMAISAAGMGIMPVYDEEAAYDDISGEISAEAEESGSFESFSMCRMQRGPESLTAFNSEKFDAGSCTAFIVPMYEAKSVTLTETDELIGYLAEYTDGSTGTAIAELPEDSRFNIVLTDEQGNEINVYSGEGFVCFSQYSETGTDFYYFGLTAEQSAEFEKYIISHIDG